MAVPAAAAVPAFQIASSVAQTLTKPIVNYESTWTTTKGRKHPETHVHHASVALSGLDILTVGGAAIGVGAALWVLGLGVRPATPDERGSAKTALQTQLDQTLIDLDVARQRLQALIDHPYEQPRWEQKVAAATAEVHRLEAEVARLQKLLRDSPLGPGFRIERRPRITEWNLTGAIPLPLPSVADATQKAGMLWTVANWLLGRAFNP